MRVLDARINRVRAALARNGSPETVDPRVAASIAQLGLAARLIAPVIGLAALELGHADTDDWWWQDELGGPFPLSIAMGDGHAQALGGVVETITTVMANKYGVPLRTVWGNVASGTNSAAQLITRARPDLGARAREVVDEILADPRVEGGRLRSGPSFRRNSCCLIYRLDTAASSVCGDCVLQR
jgi:hypothetical protein